LFYILGTKREDLHRIATQTLRFEKLVREGNLTSTLVRKLIPHASFNPERIVKSFNPGYTAFKEYITQRIEPKRFVGVGYKDQGSLSTAPSWKEQIVSDGEENLQKSEKLNGLYSYISLLVSELESTNKVYPAEESKKGRKGKTSARVQLTQWKDLDLHFGGWKGEEGKSTSDHEKGNSGFSRKTEELPKSNVRSAFADRRRNSGTS